MRTALRVLARLAVAAVALLVGAYLLYGFGAGYFGALGVGLPTPLNVVATVALAAGLLRGVGRFLRRPLPAARRAAGSPHGTPLPWGKYADERSPGRRSPAGSPQVAFTEGEGAAL